MVRRARIESMTGFYHVVARGLNKEMIFKQKREKIRILNLIRENLKEYSVEIYAYCIMSNHFHIIIKAELKELASFMAKILAGYAQYYNYKHCRVGYVFQGRYRSQCIETEEYLWNCLRYIHLNPVKANMCKDFMSYAYSSAKEYFEIPEKDKKILHENAHIILGSMFGSRREFREFHRLNCRNIFIDISEEELSQRKFVAGEILQEMQEELEVPMEEILDYIKLRNEFERRIKEELNIPQEQARKIRRIFDGEKGQGK